MVETRRRLALVFAERLKAWVRPNSKEAAQLCPEHFALADIAIEAAERRQEAVRILVECAEYYASPEVKGMWIGGGRAQHALNTWRDAQ